MQRCGSPHLEIQRYSQRSTCLTRSSEKFNSLCGFLGSLVLIMVPSDSMDGSGV